MNRAELIRAFVVDSVSNDDEDLGMIVYEVTRWAEEDGFAAAVPEILQELKNAMELGLVRYWSGPPEPAGPTIHFRATAEGKEFAARYWEAHDSR